MKYFQDKYNNTHTYKNYSKFQDTINWMIFRPYWYVSERWGQAN